MTSRSSRMRRSSVGRMELIQESPDSAPAHSAVKHKQVGALSTVQRMSMPRAKSDNIQLKRSKSFTTDSSRNRVRSVPAYPEITDILMGKLKDITDKHGHSTLRRKLSNKYLGMNQLQHAGNGTQEITLED